MKIATFGESFTAAATYSGGPINNWIKRLTDGLLAHQLHSNHAVGGALSGMAEHYAYTIDGVLHQAKGMIGQVNDYIDAGAGADVHIIGPLMNDLVCAAILDPFATQAGNQVETTQLVQAFRDDYINTQGHTELEYGNWIVENYMAANVHMAVTKLKDAGEHNIIVLGYPNLGVAPICGSDPDKISRATSLSYEANNRVGSICQNYDIPFVNLYDIEYTTIDEIHPDGPMQEDILMGLLEAVY